MASLKKPVAAPAKKAAPAKTTAKSAAAEPAAKPAAKKGFPPKKDPNAPAKPRPPAATWDAPSDMRPGFFLFSFTTDAHGLMDPRSVEAFRVKGSKWSEPDTVRYNLRDYDVNTVIGLATRVAYTTFAPNAEKRLPAETKFTYVLRAATRRNDGTLGARIVAISRKQEGKKLRWFEDKTDPTYRKLRKCARILSSAFVDVQLPPSTRRKSSSSDDE